MEAQRAGSIKWNLHISPKIEIYPLQKDAEVIDLLDILIEDFDNRTIEEIGISKAMSPVETLIYLMEESNLTKSELARQLDVSRQLITEIVNYERNISKKIALKL